MSVWDESPLPPPVAGTSATPPPPDPPSAPGGKSDDEAEPRRRALGLPIWLAVVLGTAICLAIAGALVFGFGSDGDDPAVTGTDPPTRAATEPPPSVAPTTSPPSLATTTIATTTIAPTTAAAIPATTAPATTAPATTAPATTIPATTTPATTTPATTTTTPATTTPATTTAQPTSVVGADGQRLTVTPRRGPCGTATDCLVVGFTIDGFSTQPQTFVCEFASGRRYEFRFSGDGVERACATNDAPDSIVVEVGGLRSDPATNSR